MGNSYNFSKTIGDNEEKNEFRTVYRVRRPKGNFEKTEENYSKTVETIDEKIDGMPKRYHANIKIKFVIYVKNIKK